jgi:CheY-like chemotaxis protein
MPELSSGKNLAKDHSKRSVRLTSGWLRLGWKERDLGTKQRNSTLPASDATSAACRSADAAVTKPRVTPRILVVEDQDDVRRMVATVLELEGYQVDKAANAQEGLWQLRYRRYHLVISDYAMPGGTGMWMLREAARMGLMERTTAIIVTAYHHVRDLADIMVIDKPLDLDAFLELVRATLEAPFVPMAITGPGPSTTH